MKNLFKWTLSMALVFGFGVSLSQAGSFEGEVDYTVTMNGGDKGPMNYMIKGSQTRVDMTMKGHHMIDIMDFNTKKIIMLMPEQKMYMTSDIPASSKAKAEDVKFTKTGNTKTILGHSTEEWKITSKQGVSSLWAASGMGFFAMSQGPHGQGPDTSWVVEAKAKGLFPLEMDNTGNKGGSMTMVATKIDEKTLDSSLFEIPSGYKDMSAMMQGMGAGMPSGMPKF